MKVVNDKRLKYSRKNLEKEIQDFFNIFY